MTKLNSRSKIFLVTAVISFLALVSLAKLATSHHSLNPLKHPATHSAASTPTSPSGATSVLNDYPPSRFQSRRPTEVTGLQILFVSKKNTAELSWNPNPAGEGVDSYALYYYSSAMLYPSGASVGVLAAVVKTTTLSTKIVGTDGPLLEAGQPYGANEIPTCDNADNCTQPDQISIWVIAHNKYGWGDNDAATPNPDENPANFSPLSFNQMKQLKTPQVTRVALSELDPNFSTGSLPTYLGGNNVDSLSNTPPPNSPWVVPWIPEGDSPLSRFQPGRPTIVKGLKLDSIDERDKLLILSWNANPASEKVDEYAVYARGSQCADDYCPTTLLTVVKGTTLKEPINFRGQTGFNDPIDTPGYISFTPNSLYSFSIIAHNKNGWGDNDPSVPNPDQNEDDFRKLTPNQMERATTLPTEINVDVPCTALITGATGCSTNP